MLNHTEKGRVTSKDLGTGVDLEKAKQQKAEKIKLGRNVSTPSSGGSDALRGPLGGGAAAGTHKKKKTDDDIALGISPSKGSAASPSIARAGSEAGPAGSEAALDNPKNKAAQTFLRGALSKLQESNICVEAVRQAKSLIEVDDPMLANTVRALSLGSCPKRPRWD